MKPYKIFAVLIGMLLAASCEPELVGVVRFDDDDNPQTRSLTLSIGSEDWPETRTSLGTEVETIFSGAVLAAYDASSGRLDSELRIAPEALGGEISITLPAGRSYNLYLLGNLWEIGSDGSKRGVSFPADESSLEDFYYRMDGGGTADGYRRETFAESAIYGIPVCWSYPGVAPSSAKVSVIMQRLFSKLTVEVDHSGIAGTSLDAFVNGSLKLRQVNCRLMPFAPDGSRALSAGDVLAYGDADATMENALCREFVYYVPENRQGELLPGNTDPSLKTLDSVEAVKTGLGGLVTYVEFRADMGAESGFSGSAVYRFLLGRDAVGDFDIGRNLGYRVSLGFRAESIFAPEWKVEVDGLTDRREFYLSGSLAGKLPAGQKVVVRKNRAAELDLNLEMSGGGANVISSARLVDEGYTPSSLTDVAWTADFWSATHDSAHEPQREALAALGIAVSYAGGRFLFEVSDPSRFAPGSSVPLTLTLYPGGRKISAEIVTRDDITVSGDTGAPEDLIYVAQCRNLSFSGFEGDTVFYVADQNSASGGLHSYNTHWKASPSLSASFPGYYRTASDGSIVYPFSEPSSYTSQSLPSDGTLQLCCFGPTDSRDYDGKSAPGSILICSNDPLNDGIITIPLNIRLPKLKDTNTRYSLLALPFDGSGVAVGFSLTATDGSALKLEDFNETLYDALLKPVLTFDSAAYPWLQNIEIDIFSGTAYLARTSLGSDNIEDAFPIDTGKSSYSLGSISIAMTSMLNRHFTARTQAFAVTLPRLTATADLDWCTYLTQSEEDTEISVYVKCAQGKGDLSCFEFNTSGEGVEFECFYGSKKVLRPVIEGTYDGVANYKWSYRESSQPTQVDGEYVPGGLILPYGPQTVTLTVTNRWDGRKLVSSSSFTIKHSAHVYQIGLFNRSKTATVYPLPPKNIKYVMSLYSKVPIQTRQWMLKILGGDEWLKHYISGPDFMIGTAGYRKYKQTSTGVYWHRQNFPVSYMDESATSWSADLARQAYEDSNCGWLNAPLSDSGMVSGWQEDPSATGNKYLKLLLSNNKGGYVYTGDYLYY